MLGIASEAQSPETTGESTIPTTAELSKQACPGKRARDFLPSLTILYIKPGGHRQWPTSISAVLERFSLLVWTTRKSAIDHLDQAVESLPKGRPMHQSRGAHKQVVVAPPPIKFLDIGTKMGLYEFEELTPDVKKVSSVLHPRSTTGIPVPGTFYEAMQKKLGMTWAGISCGVIHLRGSTIRLTMTSMCTSLLDSSGDCRLSSPHILGRCLNKAEEESMWTLSQIHCVLHLVIWPLGTSFPWSERNCVTIFRNNGLR